MQVFICILDKFTALTLELIMGFFSIIGIIISFYGINKIPFYIDKILFKHIFTINIPFLIIILFILCLFILFRKFRLINNKLNNCCNYLSIILVSISLLGFLLNLIVDIFIINNVYFYDKKAKKNKSAQLTDKEWNDTVMVILFTFIIYLALIFLSLSDNLRINLKIDDSYYKYQLAIEEEINNEKLENANQLNTIKDKPKENNAMNEIKEKPNKSDININDINLHKRSSEIDLNKKLNLNEEGKN
jgi:hypothetical protein